MADFHGLDIGWMQAQYRDCKNKREAELLESLAEVRRKKEEIAGELDDLLALLVNGEGGGDGKDQV
jgi:hypothetical protein